ncbi:hypothetical protein Q1695_000210 [Nippostrongylus brasiliensis]|nr:hypothetical protein Q1695_000210 [Nippostrongylus brasiliensis]
MVKNEVETKNERGKPEHSAATSVSPDSPTNQQQRTHSSHTASTSTKTREPEPALLKKSFTQDIPMNSAQAKNSERKSARRDEPTPDVFREKMSEAFGNIPKRRDKRRSVLRPPSSTSKRGNLRDPKIQRPTFAPPSPPRPATRTEFGRSDNARSRSSDGFRESGRVGDPENVRVTVVKSENRRVIKEESWRRGARRDLSREFHDERSRSPHPSSRVDDRKRFEDRSRSDHRPNNLFGASRIDEFLNERWERYPSYDRYDEYRH